MKKIILIVLISFCSTLLVAFDGERKGFLLGIGFGGAYYSFTQTLDNGYTSVKSDTETGLGFSSDFMIGYAPTNQLEIYYSSKVSWFEMENVYNDTVIIASGVAGLGIGYHFVSADVWNPNFYIAGTIGLATWALPFEDDADTWEGVGGTIGLGFEFAKHYSLFCSVKVGSPEESESGITMTTDIVSVDITFNALAY